MENAPDATAVAAAVTALHDLVQTVFHGDPPPPDDAAHWTRIAGAAQQIDTQARWCRDATVAIARRAGAQWADLQHATGVADSTLDSRLRAFLRGEGKTT